MFAKIWLLAAGGMVALSALAADMSQVEKTIELKDGSTVYLFSDGKMGMESNLGKAVTMTEGNVMETKDGQKIVMIGDEFMRVQTILHAQHGQGG